MIFQTTHKNNKFTYSVIKRYKELDSSFMLNTTTNTISGSTDLNAECNSYITFDEHSILDPNMPIIHTKSREIVLNTGFTASLSKRYSNLKRNIVKKTSKMSDRRIWLTTS